MLHREPMAILGNAYSPHVRQWLRVLARSSIFPEVYSVHPKGVGTLVDAKVHVVLPQLTWLPALFRYLLGGLYIRLFLPLSKKPRIFHAHNASGYGLMAYLSGVPYVVTTYGSEIFLARQKGWLYRAVVRRILQKSLRITGTTEAMARSLMQNFGVPRRRIAIFSLGVDGPFVYSEGARQRVRAELHMIHQSAPIFFANRRIHPHYNVLELCRAFKTAWHQERRGLLLLLEGDSDKAYLKLVEQEVADCDSIRILYGFVDQKLLCEYLCASDFIISIPNSDQLSSSVLEAAVCMNVPIMSDIEAYKDFLTVEGTIRLSTLEKKGLASQLSALMHTSPEALYKSKNAFFHYCASNCSPETVDCRVREIYQLSDK